MGAKQLLVQQQNSCFCSGFVPAMETGGSKSAAYAVWLVRKRKHFATCTVRSFYRVIRISEFRYTEVRVYVHDYKYFYNVTK